MSVIPFKKKIANLACWLSFFFAVVNVNAHLAAPDAVNMHNMHKKRMWNKKGKGGIKGKDKGWESWKGKGRASMKMSLKKQMHHKKKQMKHKWKGTWKGTWKGKGWEKGKKKGFQSKGWKGKGKWRGKGKGQSTLTPTSDTVSPTLSPTLLPTANQGERCITFDCGEGYVLRENPEDRIGNDRETCCFREGVCAGAQVGDPCSLGDISASLIPNPSFEDFSSCPTSFSQLFLADTWVQATDATSDFFVTSPTCPESWRSDFASAGVSDLPLQGSDGDGFVGAISQGIFYVEYVGACLIEPLLAGVQYTFNMDINAAGSGGTSYGGDTNGETDMLCVPSCNEFPIAGSEYMGNRYEVLATAAPSGGLTGGDGWKSMTFEVSPTQDCPAIMFGPSAGQTVEPGKQGTYVLYDFLNLQEGSAGVCNQDGECVPP